MIIIIKMYTNYILIDTLLHRNNIFKKGLLGTTIITTAYFINKYNNVKIEDVINNDLRVKEIGKCDKELNDFGKCLEEHNDNFDKCRNFLEAYKKCLQN